MLRPLPSPQPESTECPRRIDPESLTGNVLGSPGAAPRRGLHHPSGIPWNDWGFARSGVDKEVDSTLRGSRMQRPLPSPQPQSTECPRRFRSKRLTGKAFGSPGAAPRRGLHHLSGIPLGDRGIGRSGIDKHVDSTLRGSRILRPLPSPQGRVAAPSGADGRGQTVPGHVQPLTPYSAFGDTSP
jgi:hypothetical protein